MLMETLNTFLLEDNQKLLWLKKRQTDKLEEIPTMTLYAVHLNNKQQEKMSYLERSTYEWSTVEQLKTVFQWNSNTLHRCLPKLIRIFNYQLFSIQICLNGNSRFTLGQVSLRVKSIRFCFLCSAKWPWRQCRKKKCDVSYLGRN